MSACDRASRRRGRSSRSRPDRRYRHARERRRSVPRGAVGRRATIRAFTLAASPQARDHAVERRGEALVHDPGERLDARRDAGRPAASCRLVDGRRFGQRHQQDARERAVAQPWQQLSHVRRARRSSCARPRGGTPPRRRAAASVWPVGAVSRTTKPSCAHGDGPREGAEHRDLLGARRAQVLFEQRAASRVQCVDAGREHLVPCRPAVSAAGSIRLTVRPRSVAAERRSDVRGRIGGAQVHARDRAVPAPARRAAAIVVLPTPPLPIVRTTPWPTLASSCDELRERGGVVLRQGGRRQRRRGAQARRREDPPEAVEAEGRPGQQRHLAARQRREAGRHALERPRPRSSSADAIASVAIRRREDAVDDEVLVADADGLEFRPRARRLRPEPRVGTGDEHDGRRRVASRSEDRLAL